MSKIVGKYYGCHAQTAERDFAQMAALKIIAVVCFVLVAIVGMSYLNRVNGICNSAGEAAQSAHWFQRHGNKSEYLDNLAHGRFIQIRGEDDEGKIAFSKRFYDLRKKDAEMVWRNPDLTKETAKALIEEKCHQDFEWGTGYGALFE